MTEYEQISLELPGTRQARACDEIGIDSHNGTQNGATALLGHPGGTGLDTDHDAAAAEAAAVRSSFCDEIGRDLEAGS